MQVSALIVAAGRGVRAGAVTGYPKQYQNIAGQSVLLRALTPFYEHTAINSIRTVIAADDRALYNEATQPLADRLGQPIIGGATRQASVLAGLQALSATPPDVVLIHDAARPFVDVALIDRVLAALTDKAGVVPAIAVADTLKRSGTDGVVRETVSRADLYGAQTPQGFRFPQILAAHQAAAQQVSLNLTDDAGVAEWFGIPVNIVVGDPRNRKLTSAEDMAMADQELRTAAMPTIPDVRVGNGFDVHRLVPGDHVWLCGVRIAHSQALDGHSDADVGLHALTDAILGALGEGDIGLHFPPSDEAWKDVASHIFLRHAASLVHARGAVITHVDVTLVCEAPRIQPHVSAMRVAVADILSLARHRVSIKATTSEGLGFPGRREGIAALATATLSHSMHE